MTMMMKSQVRQALLAVILPVVVLQMVVLLVVVLPVVAEAAVQ